MGDPHFVRVIHKQEFGEVVTDAGDGEVVLIPVATLDEALAVLESLGGDPIAL